MNLFTLKGIRPWVLSTAAAVWLATVCNITLWKSFSGLVELSNLQGYWFIAAFGIAITGLCAALISLFCTRFSHKAIISALLMTAAACTYFMWTYGIVIDRSMIVNALQTDGKESLELINFRMAGMLLVLAFLPMLVIWCIKVNYAPGLRQLCNNILFFALCIACVAAALLSSFQTVASTMRNHPQLRHQIAPLNAINGTLSVLLKSDTSSHTTALPIGQDAVLGSTYSTPQKPPLLLLVVGETARYDHFSLNGYSRNTNPKLSKEDVISLKNMWSCGTSTAASVPCMFSHLGKTAYEDSDVRYENLLDVLQNAGLGVVWFDNQAGCKGLCDRVPTVNVRTLKTEGLCTTGECRDTVMLKIIDAEVAMLPETRRSKGLVVVLHQMGSHGPAYYLRTDEAHKHFKPECSNNALNTCQREHVINAYDNTIVATDDFLAQSIDWLKSKSSQFTTSMMYMSDHGESLGENNIYLHGLPYRIAPEAQKRIPWITWLSHDAATRGKLSTACLKQGIDKQGTHDSLFHSVLGLLDVQTNLYKEELDLFKPCKS